MRRLIVILMFLGTGLWAFSSMNIIDTPTSDTLLRGYYDIYLSAYEAGGIKTKVAIGLADRITLGISEDVGGVIGDGNVTWTIPGVMAKLNIFNYTEKKIGLAIGYNNFYGGEYGKTTITETNSETNISSHKEIIYGLYAVATLPIQFFGQQIFSFGARYPLLPIKMSKTASDLNLFANFSFAFNPELKLNMEIENIDLSSLDRNRPILNAGFVYVAGDVLSVSLNFRYSLSDTLNPLKNPSRSIVIEYQNLFY